ncbi:MAG: HAMP domain-containing sensor histidine kinase [Meiothermus sp.]|uniref:sensor histidine kinase n=1 Tax=Meiothermus sp. TaxID=1955249 RepID=UPI00298EDF5C|nr:HAMP domain-containing sensor histidine kinase [Meiothermus sp.]MCX7740256.1 HAMP domain-containing histidine kinase [Meiothermus sp.]MDW8480925.1 HAMP domain-containing sensor histidine kinase [Meiothermus sp.]
MSLRLRFAFLTAFVVLSGLALTGLALREGLQLALLHQASTSLDTLLNGVQLKKDEDGEPRFQVDAALLEAVLPGTFLLLVGEGRLQDAVGLLPSPDTLAALVEGRKEGFLVRESEREGLVVKGARDLASLLAPLSLLDRLLPPVLLLGGLLAFALGLFLSGRALAPLARATLEAQGLAQARAWSRRLTPPAQRDEVGHMVEAFNQVLAALEEALAAERRFANEAAHALRTPLTLLLGHLERGRLTEAKAQAEGLRELVERLLLLARAEADALQLEPVELDTLVFTQAESLRPAFHARGVRLSLQLPEEPVWVLAHEPALRAIVVSLLENALQHTAKGGWVQVQVGGGGLEVTNAPSHPRPGSGLGLRLAEALAKAQGARLGWSSEERRFLVFLRLKED